MCQLKTNIDLLMFALSLKQLKIQLFFKVIFQNQVIQL